MSLKKTILKVFPIHYFRFNKSYSQEGEDLILKDIFFELGIRKGFFVDVGAHHPVRFSNTYLLYKKGWNGINFEPNISSGRIFQVLRKRDKTYHIGIGNEEGEKDFYVFDEPAINSFDKETSLERDKNSPYKLLKTVKIPILKLSTALSKFLPSGRKIDLMSVDVEGLDLEVLKSNDWEKFRPTVLLVEDMYFDMETPQNSEIWLFLRDKGYKVYAKTKRTLVFIENSA